MSSSGRSGWIPNDFPRVTPTMARRAPQRVRSRKLGDRVLRGPEAQDGGDSAGTPEVVRLSVSFDVSAIRPYRDTFPVRVPCPRHTMSQIAFNPQTETAAGLRKGVDLASHSEERI